ncbi:hypothetical protein GOP47_0030004 [Adiantum capillus-veneris]|nr:hypothetical protein GOP47_0030004 [Adiantum capillus-veneris]
MVKESSQVVASQRNCKDAKVVCEQNVKLTPEQDAKEVGLLCEVELKYERDAKGLEPDDGHLPQVHVLAVDDNFVDRKIVERLAKSASFTVTTVDSGAKALEVLSSNNHINLILTDYCMPEMSGYDLLKHVKESPTLKDIPVVIMSSENVPNRIQRCLEDGAEEFLIKPVRVADMKRLRSYVFPRRENAVEQHNLLCKKRKFNSDEFQVQSPERGLRLGSVTVA